MLTFYAGHFVLALDNLNLLSEILTYDPPRLLIRPTSLEPLMRSIEGLRDGADAMALTSSAAQARRLLQLWAAVADPDPKRKPLPKDIIDNAKELERRIRDDLHQRLFFCVSVAEDHLLERDPSADPTAPTPGPLRIKTAGEYFGETVVRRFPQIESDLSSACRCLALNCDSACVFHLMRATEIAVPKVATLCGVRDPRPSWGSVLDQAEKYTQKTKHEHLPDTLKPHVEFLRTLVADMRSMQRAWRNRVVHVDEKLVLGSGEFTSPIANEILVSTKTFLAHLAAGVPDWC